MRNIKEVETGSRKPSFDIERKLHGFMNGGSKSTLISSNFETTVFATPGPKPTQIELTNQATILLLQRIYNELKIITKQMIEAERDDSASNQWKFAAMVVDRFCLYLFSAFIITTTIAILMSAPYLVA